MALIIVIWNFLFIFLLPWQLAPLFIIIPALYSYGQGSSSVILSAGHCAGSRYSTEWDWQIPAITKLTLYWRKTENKQRNKLVKWFQRVIECQERNKAEQWNRITGDVQNIFWKIVRQGVSVQMIFKLWHDWWEENSQKNCWEVHIPGRGKVQILKGQNIAVGMWGSRA